MECPTNKTDTKGRVIDIRGVIRGDAILDRARALYGRTGETPRPVAIGEIMQELNLTTYTTNEVANILGVRPETVRLWLREGKLKGFQVGKGYRVSQVELGKFWSAKGGGELFGVIDSIVK